MKVRVSSKNDVYRELVIDAGDFHDEMARYYKVEDAKKNTEHQNRTLAKIAHGDWIIEVGEDGTPVFLLIDKQGEI